MFTLTRDWFEDAESKFRENMDWSANWGSADFPTGTGEDNGANIPVTAGTYDVTFDYSTKAYTFTPNPNLFKTILNKIICCIMIFN
jgi:hypothetical protein